MQKDDAIDTLNHLIAIAKDGINGMKSAAESATSQNLKSTLQRLSQERGQVASQLQGVVRSLGGDPESSGTTLGAAHRTFMNVKDAVTGTDDKALLRECERGEDHAVREFREALAKSLPPTAVQEVESALSQVQKSHDEIKRLRNITT
jgi:uncharacterized protein (TIGR02284 family)